MNETDPKPHIPATFPKKEKLCSIKEIEELFRKGSSHFLYPYRILFNYCKEGQQKFPKVLISVPKKNFKKSADRNRLKRQIREAYRLNKSGIFLDLEPQRRPCNLAIVYIAKEKIPFEEIQKKLISILLRLKNT